MAFNSNGNRIMSTSAGPSIAFSALVAIALGAHALRRKNVASGSSNQSLRKTRMKRIAILNCPGGFDYVPFFHDMFRKVGINPVVGVGEASATSSSGKPVEFEAFQVHQGEFPANICDFDGYLLTGSTNGAYELISWIEKLRERLVDIRRAKIPLVGVCFGHQLIAHALGGKAAKNQNGWELGTASFPLSQKGRKRLQQLAQRSKQHATATLEIPRSLRLAAVHGDEVAIVPPGFTSLGGNANTQCEGMVSDDLTVLTVQGHPEFTAESVRHLVGVLESRIDPARDTPGTHYNGVVSMASQGVSKSELLQSASVDVQADANLVARLALAVFGVL